MLVLIMVVERINCLGYEEFQNCIQNFEENKIIYCYFTGSKIDDGRSWCSDCVKSLPFIMDALQNYAIEGSVFIFVQVGDKISWRDLENPFRTDKLISLKELPTLLRWKQVQRLEGSYHCSKDDILKMFFTEDLVD